jgi:hypothetical protein
MKTETNARSGSLLWAIPAVVTAFFSITRNASAREQAGQDWYRVNVHLSSPAPMPPALIRKSQETATTIFRRIRVQLTWTGQWQQASKAVTACLGQPATNDLDVEIVPHAPARNSDFALGMAMPHADSGVRIVIFYDRVEMLYGHHASRATILGNVLAHEIAHVLEATARHSAAVMRERWTDKNFGLIAQGLLPFTTDDEQMIRRGPASLDASFTVAVYDYAGLSDSVMNELETLSAVLLSRAGIRTHWVHCLGHLQGRRPALCDANLQTGSLLIRILAAHPGHPNKLGDPLGSAVVENSYASLYASEIRRYADQNGLSAGSLMAYAAAHEIGHLLLGENHSSSGIMRAVWGKTEYRDIAQRRLGFSTAERQALRQALPARDALLAD